MKHAGRDEDGKQPGSGGRRPPRQPGLEKFAGRVSDSGEGRWTAIAAIDESVPAPVLSAALYERFGSRGEADFADKMLWRPEDSL